MSLDLRMRVPERRSRVRPSPSPPSQLQDHVAQSIRHRHLFRQGRAILLAVSGGLDSMVLLRLLSSLSRVNGWRLCIAHFNHQLRGRNSDADERLVRRTAEAWKLPIVVERADVRGFAQAQNLSLEMAARKLRHDFLARVAIRRRIRIIALGHHADDQIELFFLRLLRGSGGEGLAGMKWRNPSPANTALDLVRPLLDQPKSALRQFAGQQKLRFREDATNASLDIQRNRLRHELLPLLKHNYQPALEKALLRTMDIVGSEAELATQMAQDWLLQREVLVACPASACDQIARPPIARFRSSTSFDDLPLAVQRRCLLLQLHHLGIVPDYDLVEHLRQSVGQASLLPPSAARPREWAVVRDGQGKLCIIRPQTSRVPVFDRRSLWVNLKSRAGKVEFGQSRIFWRIQRRTTSQIPAKKSARESFDADRVGSPILLRFWQAGDKFQPIGMGAAVKLQDIFTNLKVPRPRRHKLLVATTVSGEVFWVEDLRIAERFKLTDSSIRRLQWAWHPL